LPLEVTENHKRTGKFLNLNARDLKRTKMLGKNLN